MINKLNKEKKHISEKAAKSAEDLGAAEDKVGHLNQVRFFWHLITKLGKYPVLLL